MKKFVAIVLTLSLFLVIGAIASVAYPAVEADNIASFDVQEDGSVLITVDKDQIEAETGYTLNGMVEIAIYENDPGFNSESNMFDAYNAAQVGKGNVGLQSEYVYKVNVGGNTAAQSGEYPFKAETTYYFIFCVGANDAEGGWMWFPEAVTFTYPVVEGNNGYPCTNADWGINAVVQEDGSVLITYDREKVNASKDGWNSAQANIAIYDEDPQFNALSAMVRPQGDEANKYPYSDASVGLNNAGQTSAGAASYLVLDGDSVTNGDATTNPTYPFEEGQQYWIVVCDSNGSGWYWNYQPFVLTYEIPGEEPTPTPTATATATPTATATEGATETAATTEAATTEAAATTAAAETTAAATGTQSTDNTDDGGDFSVLIYLAAALAAGGGAAFAFRKKNRA